MRSAGTASLGAVVVVVAGTTVVVVTLGADVCGALTVPAVPMVRSDVAIVAGSDRAVGVVVVVVVVVVVALGVGAAVCSCPPGAATRAAARVGRSSRCDAEGVPPAVATSSAMRPSETARMTHQLGRPRATRERRPSPPSRLPPNTNTRCAR